MSKFMESVKEKRTSQEPLAITTGLQVRYNNAAETFPGTIGRSEENVLGRDQRTHLKKKKKKTFQEEESE
ncbi:hypothetical protein EUGRSUZ_K02709 [Eucalyptus grandis]|uniref:Uncharacterized protein n=2 Tax=Eucalyptus grandis TaxID=71139 RepID=A0ACC3IZY4_EUCGR|nr:hypothetical protein EUGRSUZ_K02709 [Eucalyptus grandis]